MPPPEFLDCELYLTGYDQARFSVAGREYSGRPVLDEALQNRLTRAALDPAQYGKYLFDALFPGGGDDLCAGYREALAIARHEEKRLRFRLHVATTAPAKLHELHWEFLYDTKKKIALGHSRETTFSRYLSVGDKPRAAVAEKPRILVVISIPSNASKFSLPELDREEIRQSIVKSLTSLDSLASYEILDPPATASRICETRAPPPSSARQVFAPCPRPAFRSPKPCASTADVSGFRSTGTTLRATPARAMRCV